MTEVRFMAGLAVTPMVTANKYRRRVADLRKELFYG